MSKMTKILTGFIFLLAFITFFPGRVYAVYDPREVSNNSFGIHIANIQDIDDAATLVNSNSGDWGYVTLVITENNRDVRLWQNTFDKMRRLHLIPIVRVATEEENGNWKKPETDDVNNWVSFFNSLNWVIKNRYLIIGNETNSNKEWGGQADPEEYADYLKTFSVKLKNENSDYFVMAGGFDASLPTGLSGLNESVYLQRMLQKEPDIFNNLDGLSSHSYPNPDFSGSVYASGKGTVRTFEWELNYLKVLGVKKDLPVFITETGWAHRVNTNLKTYKYPEEKDLTAKYEAAFNNIWSQKNVVAVTPFILNYEFSPFDIFSWKSGGEYEALFNSIKGLNKTAGKPIQEDKAQISGTFVPAISFMGNDFTGLFFVENKGQTIWSRENLSIVDENGNTLPISKISLTSLEPGSSGFVVFQGKIPQVEGTYKAIIYLENSGKKISNPSEFRILSLVTIQMRIKSILNEFKKTLHLT